MAARPGKSPQLVDGVCAAKKGVGDRVREIRLRRPLDPKHGV